VVVVAVVVVVVVVAEVDVVDVVAVLVVAVVAVVVVAVVAVVVVAVVPVVVVVDDVAAPPKFDIYQYLFYLRPLWKFLSKKLELAHWDRLLRVDANAVWILYISSITYETYINDLDSIIRKAPFNVYLSE